MARIELMTNFQLATKIAHTFQEETIETKAKMMVAVRTISMEDATTTIIMAMTQMGMDTPRNSLGNIITNANDMDPNEHM